MLEKPLAFRAFVEDILIPIGKRDGGGPDSYHEPHFNNRQARAIIREKQRISTRIKYDGPESGFHN